MKTIISHERQWSMPAQRRAELMIRFARRFNRPTSGIGAAFIWASLSSQSYYDGKTAKKIYLAMGYKPFAGYPLTQNKGIKL